MIKKILLSTLTAIGLLGALQPIYANENKFLEPDQAFHLNVSKNNQDIKVNFKIAEGYYLYKERIHVNTQPENLSFDFVLPEAKKKFDNTFNKEVEYYRHTLNFDIKIKDSKTNEFLLVIKNQGCADAGLCYSPMKHFFKVKENNITKISDEEFEKISVATKDISPAIQSEKEESSINKALNSKNYLTVIGVFLLAGLLLSFTPCVLPMIPILSSIIVGQKEPPTRTKGFLLALSYALGMSIVYTLFGMAAGLMGEGLAAWLQNPWVLGVFAILLSGFAMSMFGFFELQMPSFIQGKANDASSKIEGGSFKGTFLMGGLSALIVGPCVAAPLAGALVYISQTKDMVLGGLALFSLSSGMSVPLLLVGASAGTLLPSAGSWMEAVKTFFGFLLLGVAVWMVNPVLPIYVTMLLIATLLLISASTLKNNDDEYNKMNYIKKGISTLFITIAILQIIGAFSGGSITQPLLGLKSNAINNTAASNNMVEFKTIPAKDIMAYIDNNKDKTIMLDFWAQWCVACQEMEHLTFNQPSVLSAAKNMVSIKVDVTDNTKDDRDLMKNFGLFGPPATMFFKNGKELQSSRLIGFENATDFTKRLQEIK